MRGEHDGYACCPANFFKCHFIVKKNIQAVVILLSVKTRRRAATGNTRSREASGTAGGPRSLGQRPSDLARALAESR
jgi:hypothetical protein